MNNKAKMSNRVIDWQRRHSAVIMTVFVLAALIPLGTTWSLFFDIGIWRHDAVYYLASYLPKLEQEGRWLNYVLFEYHSYIKPQPSALIQTLCLGVFVLNATFRICRDRLYALMVALLAVAAVPLYIQLLWPVTPLPAFVLLGLAPLFSKWLPAPVFFGVFGVLLFGTMSHLYFLLPLLYVRHYATGDIPLREQAQEFAKKYSFPGCWVTALGSRWLICWSLH